MDIKRIVRLLKNIFLIILVFLLLFGLFALDANARIKRHKHRYDFTKSQRYASLVVDAVTGNVLWQRNANKILYPASLTKLMTIYITLQAIDGSKLSLDDTLNISTKAILQPKTNLKLKRGQGITVRECLHGLIVHSANDAAVVLAEAIAGNESNFAKLMTLTAQQLGMKSTNFINASGLPHPQQVTTAYDMAKLAIALRRDFAHYYSMFSKRSFVFNGRIINSHNNVLKRYPWADGLKTGYTNAAGFNLVTSVSRDNSKLIGVIMGGSTATARDNHMIKLLEYGYNKLQQNILVAQAENVDRDEPPYTKSSFEVAAATTQKVVGDLNAEAKSKSISNKKTKLVHNKRYSKKNNKQLS